MDGSPPSVGALRWARDLALAVGGPIVADTAWKYTAAEAFGAYRGMEWEPGQDARVVLEGALESTYGSVGPGGLAARVVRGHAAHVLLELGHHARLVIVGSRGLGGFAGLLLGSVSAACVEHAACPVLVLHGEKHPVAEAHPTP